MKGRLGGLCDIVLPSFELTVLEARDILLLFPRGPDMRNFIEVEGTFAAREHYNENMDKQRQVHQEVQGADAQGIQMR